MEVPVVLELEMDKLKNLYQMGLAAQRVGQFGQYQATRDENNNVRVEHITPTKQGPGSLGTTDSGITNVKTIALVAIIAEKLVEESTDFVKQLLNNSSLLNSYFGSMGKVFSAIVDVLLIPFTPILNLLMIGMTKFITWMVTNNIPQKLYNAAVVLWHALQDIWDWLQKIAGFFDSWDPSKWDWTGLMSGTLSVIDKFFGWITNTGLPGVMTGILKMIDIGFKTFGVVQRGAHAGAMSIIRQNTPSWLGNALTSTDNAMLRFEHNWLYPKLSKVNDMYKKATGLSIPEKQVLNAFPVLQGIQNIVNISQIVNTVDASSAAREVLSGLKSISKGFNVSGDLLPVNIGGFP